MKYVEILSVLPCKVPSLKQLNFRNALCTHSLILVESFKRWIVYLKNSMQYFCTMGYIPRRAGVGSAGLELEKKSNKVEVVGRVLWGSFHN